MAVEPTLQILIKATDQASGVLTGVAGNVSTFAGNVKGFSQPFADLAKGILAIDGAVNTALLALGGFSIAEAGGFSSGMNEIKSLLDERTTDFDQFDKDVKGFISTSAQPIDDVLGAAYEAISQGIPAESIAAFLTSADKLATAGKSSLVDAVNLLAGTANAYGGSIKDVSGYADIFFTAVKDGKTTIPDLANAVGNVTSIAAPFGVSVGEVAGSIAALTAYGVPSTEQAATIIKQMIQGLVNPTDAAAKAAADLGISLGADVFKNHTLPEVIKDIGDKTGFSAGKISEMFTSTEALQGILPLMNDPAGKFAKVMGDIAQSSGAADHAYGIMVDNFGLMNQRMVNGIKTVLIDIGMPLLDDYAGAVMGLDGIFKALDLSIDAGALDPLTNYFGGVLHKLEDFAAKIADVLPDALSNIDWGGVEQSFDNIQGAVETVFSALFGEDIDITRADGLGRVLQGVVDAFAGLNNLNAGIISALPVFFEAVSGFVRGVAEIDPHTILNIGKGLGALLLVNVSAGLAGDIANVATSIGMLTQINPSKLAAVGSALGKAGLVGAAGATGYGIGTVLNEGIDAAVEYFTSGQNESLGGLIYDWVHGDGKLDQAMVDAGLELQKPIDKINHEVLPAAKELVSDTSGSANDFSAIKWELDADGNIAGTVDIAKNKIATLTDGADDTFDSLVNYYVSLGNSPKIATAMAKIETQTGRIPAAVKDAKDKSKVQSDKLITDLASIASDERVKNMEFSVKLDQTALQGEIDKAKAVIGTLDTQIDSTGSLLGGLFKNLSDIGSGESLKKWAIEDQISQENDLRKNAADDAHKLAQGQIKLNDLRLDRAKSGDALIKISGDGLTPALEMVLFEIAERMQVRVNEEADPLLLGS